MRMAASLVIACACSRTAQTSTTATPDVAPAPPVVEAASAVDASIVIDAALDVAGPKAPRSKRADDALAGCNIVLPPSSCASDGDCVKVAIGLNDCCGETLWVGASKTDATKVAAMRCTAPACDTPANCLVHWDRAETGDSKRPNTPIVVHCTSGMCLTSYGQR